MATFKEKVWSAARCIPRGRVASYAAVARAIGKPCGARAVGNALNKNRSPKVPCHRVVRADGMAGGYAWGTPAKIARLRKEGVVTRKGRVDNSYFLHHPPLVHR